MADQSPHANGNNAAVFCTAYVTPESIDRYQSWIDYYSAVLPDVDLYMFNDGPMQAQLDRGDVNIVEFPERLGRPSSWGHSGWKRSVHEAIGRLSVAYDFIGQVDSDCTITPQSISTYRQVLRTPGYYGSFCQRYNFSETSCQVFNTQGIRDWYAKWDEAEYNRDDHPIERIIHHVAPPQYVFTGYRYENGAEFNPHVDYVAQCPPHRFFELLFDPQNAPEGEE